MSDQSQGPGWWQASDGRWYSPERWTGPGEQTPSGDSPDLTGGGSSTLNLKKTLPSKVQRYMKKRGVLLPGESVEAVLGSSSQVIVITDRRLIVVKVGVVAGSTGGGRVTSFDFKDVTGLQVQLGVLMGSLSVQSPGYGATQTGDYWSNRNQKNVLQLPNVIVWSKPDDKKFAAELAYAHQRIATAQTPRTGEPQQEEHPPTPSLAAELQQLADLYAAGVLSESEFEAAKTQAIQQQR